MTDCHHEGCFSLLLNIPVFQMTGEKYLQSTVHLLVSKFPQSEDLVSCKVSSRSCLFQLPLSPPPLQFQSSSISPSLCLPSDFHPCSSLSRIIQSIPDALFLLRDQIIFLSSYHFRNALLLSFHKNRASSNMRTQFRITNGIFKMMYVLYSSRGKQWA